MEPADTANRRMTVEMMLAAYCAGRCVNGEQGCMLRDDRVKEWSIEDEIACAVIEAKKATKH
jgi:hypothetical protein